MIVGARADHEPVPRGHGHQVAAQAVRISGIEGFDPVQAPGLVPLDELLECREVGPLPGDDRVGEDGQAARIMEDPDGVGRRDGPRHGPGQERFQGLVFRVEAVSEDVLLPRFAVDDGQLDARDEADAPPPGGLAEGRQTLDGVVVGQRDGPGSPRREPFGQLGRSDLSVAELGVDVQVDAEEF